MAQVRKGFAVRAVCALWSWPAGAAAGCCFRVLLLEWRVHFGAGLLVPLCCQRGVCAVELACRCRCRLLQEKRRALGHLGRRQKNLLLSGVYAGVMFVNVSAKANPR